MWQSCTHLGSGTGNRVVGYTLSSGRLAHALGSSRHRSSARASQALGLAVVVDPSSTGTCSDDVDVPGACAVQLTGPLRIDARP